MPDAAGPVVGRAQTRARFASGFSGVPADLEFGVGRTLPGLQALKRDAFLAEQNPENQLLVDDKGNPSTDGPDVKGFWYDWDAYTVSGVPQS